MNKLRHLFICGYCTHGKSELANIILNGNIANRKFRVYALEWNKNKDGIKVDNNSRILSFATVLKQEICDKHGISMDDLKANKEKYRPELITVAKEKRDAEQDYFVKKLLDQTDTFGTMETLGTGRRYVIDDFRYPNEHEYSTEYGWIIDTIRVFDSDKPIPGKERVEEHYLDGALTNYVVLMRDTKLEDFLKAFPQYKNCKLEPTRIYRDLELK